MAVVKNIASTVRPVQAGGIVGELVKLNDEAQPVVSFDGCPGGAVVARSATMEIVDDSLTLPVKVLIVLEGGDPSLPIITGVIRDTFAQTKVVEKGEQSSVLRVDGAPTDVKVDGKSITLDAKEEVHLRCGKSSITLRKDGKVVIKGVQVVSRSSGSNKIKGSSVSIN